MTTWRHAEGLSPRQRALVGALLDVAEAAIAAVDELNQSAGAARQHFVVDPETGVTPVPNLLRFLPRAAEARAGAELLPPGTWFRLVWATGRIGKWHRAGKPEDTARGPRQWCPCGVTLGPRLRPRKATVETAEFRPRSGCCWETR